MKALSEKGLPVPEAIAQNRHTIVMSLVDAFPLRQISSVPDPAGLYGELMEMILRLAKLGLIHGDFNEFNILIKEEAEEEERLPEEEWSATNDRQQQQDPRIKLIPIIIDFPQMLSVDHTNADFYFDRDVSCIKRFFERRFHFLSDESGPYFAEAKAQLREKGAKRLDVEVEASGFSKKMAKELETYMKDVGVDGDHGNAERGEVEDDNESANSDPGEDGVEDRTNDASPEHAAFTAESDIADPS